MKKLKLGIIFLICIGAVFLMAGCKKAGFHSEDPRAGGKTDKTDYNAPKEIRSKELVSFKTNFFRESDWVYEDSRSYSFKLQKEENGSYLISEGYDEDLKCETDAAFAAKLEQLIRDQKLISGNGVYSVTHGLPPEYAPCTLTAEYASGEKLSFTHNNDPYAEWSGAVLDLFAKEFGAHGINDLLPKKEDSSMTRFSLHYAYGDTAYRYSEVWVPVTEEEKNRSFEDIATNGRNLDECVKKAYGSKWDRKEKAALEDEKRADTSEEHYAALKEITDEYEVLRFQNGQIMPPDFDFDHAPQFYEFYIEFESGKTMSGFSDDPDQCEKFKPIAEAYSGYYEDFLDTNRD